MKITKNNTQKLYVLDHGKFITCFGFENARKTAEALNTELNAGLQLANTGTLKLYKQYQKLVNMAKQKNLKTGFKSAVNLIPEFIGNEGRRVEVVTSYDEINRFIIGKSTGFIPCHIERKRIDSSGGPAVIGYPFKRITFLT